jgi:hypothetical protein
MGKSVNEQEMIQAAQYTAQHPQEPRSDDEQKPLPSEIFIG